MFKYFIAGVFYTILDIMFIVLPGFCVYKAYLKLLETSNGIDRFMIIIVMIVLLFILLYGITFKGYSNMIGEEYDEMSEM